MAVPWQAGECKPPERFSAVRVQRVGNAKHEAESLEGIEWTAKLHLPSREYSNTSPMNQCKGRKGHCERTPRPTACDPSREGTRVTHVGPPAIRQLLRIVCSFPATGQEYQESQEQDCLGLCIRIAVFGRNRVIIRISSVSAPPSLRRSKCGMPGGLLRSSLFSWSDA